MEILELESTITKIKNLIDGPNSRLRMTKRVTELKNRLIKMTKSKHQKDAGGKENYKDLWDYIKHPNFV